MTAKYDHIGINYNRTRSADPYLLGRLKRHLNLHPERRYLEIGCGTGNYTRALASEESSFIGMDPSQRMLDQALQYQSSVDWRLGVAEDTGLPSNYVDGVFAFLTVHHWTHLQQGIKEMARILRPKCRFVIFTATPLQMQGYWLNHYFPEMMKKSMIQMPSWESLEQGISRAGLHILHKEKYFVRPDLQDYFLYSGKSRPELYLDKTIRQGISSFADLAIAKEISSGLSRLQLDLRNNKLEEIIKGYENEDGDYLFMVLEK